METLPLSHGHENKAECRRSMGSIVDVLAQIGGKWTIYIITVLSHGPRRFSELQREVEGISQKVLTSTLRDLEKDGFVSRTVTPSIPPRVDYELTDLGRDLQLPLRAVGEWAFANRDRVDAARRQYAGRG